MENINIVIIIFVIAALIIGIAVTICAQKKIHNQSLSKRRIILGLIFVFLMVLLGIATLFCPQIWQPIHWGIAVLLILFIVEFIYGFFIKKDNNDN